MILPLSKLGFINLNHFARSPDLCVRVAALRVENRNQIQHKLIPIRQCLTRQFQLRLYLHHLLVHQPQIDELHERPSAKPEPFQKSALQSRHAVVLSIRMLGLAFTAHLPPNPLVWVRRILAGELATAVRAVGRKRYDPNVQQKLLC